MNRILSKTQAKRQKFEIAQRVADLHRQFLLSNLSEIKKRLLNSQVKKIISTSEKRRIFKISEKNLKAKKEERMEAEEHMLVVEISLQDPVFE